MLLDAKTCPWCNHDAHTPAMCKHDSDRSFPDMSCRCGQTWPITEQQALKNLESYSRTRREQDRELERARAKLELAETNFYRSQHDENYALYILDQVREIEKPTHCHTCTVGMGNSVFHPKEDCPECKGSGKRNPKYYMPKCETCKGTGNGKVTGKPGEYIQDHCHDCNGTGIAKDFHEDLCPTCGGSGGGEDLANQCHDCDGTGMKKSDLVVDDSVCAPAAKEYSVGANVGKQKKPEPPPPRIMKEGEEDTGSKKKGRIS